MKPVFLWTDVVVWLLVAAVAVYVRRVARSPHLAATWRQAFKRPVGCAAVTVLAFFVLVGLLDCVHYRVRLSSAPGEATAYSPITYSALDALLTHLRQRTERSYSYPLDYLDYEKEAVPLPNGGTERVYLRLKYGGADLRDPAAQRWPDVMRRAVAGAAGGAAVAAALVLIVAGWRARRLRVPLAQSMRDIAAGRTDYPTATVLATLGVLAVIAGVLASVSVEYHAFGTDRVGNDLLYIVLKSIRTALVIGTMTTLVTLPFSVGLGLLAGFLRGAVDEAIQYVYTVINSIPYVLLIAAAVLLLTVFIEGHPELFETSAERTDARLFFLCVILGMTSWTELCRLVRGEVMKLRELEFVQAAKAFGVAPARIMRVHLLPNLMHVILINIVISFSGLVLAEAVLSYIGIGVDPTMASFGTLINTARLELGREPPIWWSLVAAFTFMFTLVLAANFFADAVRDAFDPRTVRR